MRATGKWRWIHGPEPLKGPADRLAGYCFPPSGPWRVVFIPFERRSAIERRNRLFSFHYLLLFEYNTKTTGEFANKRKTRMRISYVILISFSIHLCFNLWMAAVKPKAVRARPTNIQTTCFKTSCTTWKISIEIYTYYVPNKVLLYFTKHVKQSMCSISSPDKTSHFELNLGTTVESSINSKQKTANKQNVFREEKTKTFAKLSWTVILAPNLIWKKKKHCHLLLW